MVLCCLHKIIVICSGCSFYHNKLVKLWQTLFLSSRIIKITKRVSNFRSGLVCPLQSAHHNVDNNLKPKILMLKIQMFSHQRPIASTIFAINITLTFDTKSFHSCDTTSQQDDDNQAYFDNHHWYQMLLFCVQRAEEQIGNVPTLSQHLSAA